MAINLVHDAKSRRDLQALDDAFPTQPINQLQVDHIPKLDQMLRELKMAPASTSSSSSASASAVSTAAATST
jgi:hypothetical protein